MFCVCLLQVPYFPSLKWGNMACNNNWLPIPSTFRNQGQGTRNGRCVPLMRKSTASGCLAATCRGRAWGEVVSWVAHTPPAVRHITGYAFCGPVDNPFCLTSSTLARQHHPTTNIKCCPLHAQQPFFTLYPLHALSNPGRVQAVADQVAIEPESEHIGIVRQLLTFLGFHLAPAPLTRRNPPDMAMQLSRSSAVARPAARQVLFRPCQPPSQAPGQRHLTPSCHRCV